MKKYRHKTLGYIVEESDFCYYGRVDDKCHQFSYPKNIVENSADWEEIKEKEKCFTTEDGVDVYEGEEYYYLYPSGGFLITKTKAFPPIMYQNNPHTIKRFSKEEEAKIYILNNKPVLSYLDVTKFVKTIMNASKVGRFDYIIIDLEKLQQLVEERIKI